MIKCAIVFKDTCMDVNRVYLLEFTKDDASVDVDADKFDINWNEFTDQNDDMLKVATDDVHLFEFVEIFMTDTFPEVQFTMAEIPAFVGQDVDI